MVELTPLAVELPSLWELAFFGLAAVLLLLKARLWGRVLSGGFLPSTLLGAYRDGKRSVEDSEE
jgi:hypothetical protein